MPVFTTRRGVVARTQRVCSSHGDFERRRRVRDGGVRLAMVIALVLSHGAMAAAPSDLSTTPPHATPASTAPVAPPPLQAPAATGPIPTEACLADLRRAAKAATLQFTANSAQMPPGATPRLTALVAALENCPGALLEIGGHADAVSDASKTNFQLSWRRAEVALATVRELGAARTRAMLYPVGYGARRPLAVPRKPTPAPAPIIAPPPAATPPAATEPNFLANLFGLATPTPAAPTPAPPTSAASPRPEPVKTDAPRPLVDAEAARQSARNRRVEFIVR